MHVARSYGGVFDVKAKEIEVVPCISLYLNNIKLLERLINSPRCFRFVEVIDGENSKGDKEARVRKEEETMWPSFWILPCHLGRNHHSSVHIRSQKVFFYLSNQPFLYQPRHTSGNIISPRILHFF